MAGFAALTPYKAPEQTMAQGASGTQGFFTPTDSNLMSGAERDAYLNPGTVQGQTNRTIKYDGGLTREQIGNLGENLSGQLGTVNQNVTSGLTGVNENLTTGFGNLAKANEGINANLGTINTNLGTGFNGLNTNIGAVNTGVTNVGKAVETGNAANAAGFTGLNSALATQGTNMDKIGANLTNYFTALNAGQDAAKAQLGTLNTGFNSFVNDYDQDTTRADQTRNQIQNSIAGGFNQVGDQIAKTSNATAQGLQNLSQPQKQGAQNLMAGVAGAGFASRPSGPTSQGAQQQAPNPQLAQGVNLVRSVLQSQGGSLAPELASSFNQIATSFDQNGQLIPSSQGTGGINVNRQMDQQGNLVSSQSDAQGNVLSSTTINLGASLSAANTLSQATRSPFA